MDDNQAKQVLQETVKFVHGTPMGLQDFRKDKEFELAVARIDGTVPFKGASGTVKATYLTTNTKDDQLRDHLTRFTGIVLLKFGKNDRVHEVVVPNAFELHRILGPFTAEELPSVLRLLLEEYAVGERRCHATVNTFLLTFFAVLFAENRDDFKWLMAELWSVDEVRTLLLPQTSYVWSNPTKYLQKATVEMPPFNGEVPERWTQLVLPSLRTGQALVKPQEDQYYDAPATPVKAVAIDADDKKTAKAFRRLMAADTLGPSGVQATDVKEQKPPKRSHSNDLRATAAKRRCRGQAAAVRQPVATKASKPPLDGPLADRKLSDVDGIDDFKGFDLPSLFGQLLVVKLCRMAFVKWLMQTVAIGQEDAERCYKGLREYAAKNVVGM